MSMELYQSVLGAFKCAELLQHVNHLRVRGDYSDHLLLGKIYESYVGRFDAFAEKGIVMWGEELVSMEVMMAKQMECYRRCGLSVDVMQGALGMEMHVLRELTELYGMLQGSGELTLGLDDLIMSTCSEIEENVYLLMQRCKR